MRCIYRYEVPVDDGWHVIELSGPIVQVGARNPYTVEFWALVGDEKPVERAFRVFGTGQPIPPAAALHRGTAFAAGGRLIWHLMEHEQPNNI
jgi:hypothetical protein